MTDADPNRMDVPAVEPTSYGARLAAARQRAGLTVTDIAARLRLHPNQVRAIESENLDALPEMAYVRGFVRSYARVVQLDPDALLADLNARAAPVNGTVVDGMKADSYSPVKAASQEQTSKRLVIGIAILVLIVLAAIGWVANQQARDDLMPAPAAAAPAAAEAPVAAMTTVATDLVANERPSASPAASDTPALEEAPAEPMTDDPAPVVAAPEEARSTAVLRLQFSGRSWLHVVDGKGKVLLSGVQQEGSEHDLQGPLPLAVVIGDSSKATVDVRGDRFDLEPVTRSNVARFRVE